MDPEQKDNQQKDNQQRDKQQSDKLRTIANDIKGFIESGNASPQKEDAQHTDPAISNPLRNDFNTLSGPTREVSSSSSSSVNSASRQDGRFVSVEERAEQIFRDLKKAKEESLVLEKVLQDPLSRKIIQAVFALEYRAVHEAEIKNAARRTVKSLVGLKHKPRKIKYQSIAKLFTKEQGDSVLKRIDTLCACGVLEAKDCINIREHHEPTHYYYSLSNEMFQKVLKGEI